MEHILDIQREARTHDYERYLCSVFAPRAVRPHIWRVLVLCHELLRIPAQSSEEMVGMVKLKWWQEQLQLMANSDPAARDDHPTLSQMQPMMALPCSSDMMEHCNMLCEALAQQCAAAPTLEHVRESLGIMYQMLAIASGAKTEGSAFRALGEAQAIIAYLRMRVLKQSSFDGTDSLMELLDQEMSALLDSRKTNVVKQRFYAKLYKHTVLWHKRIHQAQEQSAPPMLKHIPCMALKIMV